MSANSPEGISTVLIPDGDRRAAKYDITKYPQSYGKGAQNVAQFFERMIGDDRVGTAIAWGTSDKNVINRPANEILIINTAIIGFIEHVIKNREGAYRGARWVHLGNPNLLSTPLKERLAELIDMTGDQVKKICALCLGYGSDDETDRAIALAHKETGNPLLFREFLDLPYRSGTTYKKLDLIIRTGLENPDEPYTSGCLLPYQWSRTKAHHFSDLMPDINPQKFTDAVDSYCRILDDGGIKDGA